MDEPKRRGRPRKAPQGPEVVEGTALTVYEGQVLQPSREDKREVQREQRKRDGMRRKAERAAMAVWLLNQTAKQVARSAEVEEESFGQRRRSKTVKQVQDKAEKTSLEIFDQLAQELKEDLK